MMEKPRSATHRRDFLKFLGLSSLPLLWPLPGRAGGLAGNPGTDEESERTVSFVGDSLMLSPAAYVRTLQKINETKPVEPDFYGEGGVTRQLEEAFAKLTGKEKAVFMPTGTMANQLALKMLNGDNTKVMVPENSHLYRDEADAAQSVHRQRLVPVGTGKPYFGLADLKETIAYYDEGEVFRSGLGTVAVENPVRRADGTAVPLRDIQEIFAYCREKGYKLHLDGARLPIASAFTGVSVAEYASYFDTVYISLYKYLNAAGGAVLCGNADLIDRMAHQVKIHGGTVFQTWGSAAMALHYLPGMEERWKNVARAAARLTAALNKIPGVRVTAVPTGTNIYDMTLAPEIHLKKLADILYGEYDMWLGRPDGQGIVKFTVNESLLRREPQEMADAWKKAVAQARK